MAFGTPFPEVKTSLSLLSLAHRFQGLPGALSLFSHFPPSNQSSHHSYLTCQTKLVFLKRLSTKLSKTASLQTSKLQRKFAILLLMPLSVCACENSLV